MDITRKTKILIAGLAVAGLAVAGVSVAAAGGGDDSEGPIPAADLDRASAAALEATGGGEVTETEVGDEESYYEVEVTLADGSQVDVQLDQSFEVVGQENDGTDDDGDAGDDD